MFIMAVSKRNLQKYTQISLICVLEHRSSTKSVVACTVLVLYSQSYDESQRYRSTVRISTVLSLESLNTLSRAAVTSFRFPFRLTVLTVRIDESLY